MFSYNSTPLNLSSSDCFIRMVGEKSIPTLVIQQEHRDMYPRILRNDTMEKQGPVQ